MFRVNEIVKPSGKGRTAEWSQQTGTVTRVTAESVFIQWDDCAVEDEMAFDELASTGAFADNASPVVTGLLPVKDKPPTIQ